MVEELAHRFGQRLPLARRAGGVRLGAGGRPPQVELKMERAGFVATDRRVIQVARGGARHVEHEQPHDLVVDRRLRRGHRGGDVRVQLLGREPLALDQRKIDVASQRRDRPERDARPREVHEQVSLADAAALGFVLHLAPGIGGDILDASRVPRVGGDRLRHVIVPKGHIVPVRGSEVALVDQGAAVLRGAAPLTEPRHLAVQQQHVEGRPAPRPQRRPLELRHGLVRHRQHGAIRLGQSHVARLVDHDLHTERLVEAQNRSRLRGSGGVVFPRDHHDGRVRELGSQPLQLAEQEQDRRIGGAHGMEDIAGEKDQVGTLEEQVVHRPPEGFRDVRLALVPAPRGLPVVLAEPEVEIGQVGELHALTWPRSAAARSAAPPARSPSRPVPSGRP